MSVERAREFLSRFGMEDKIITFKESSATVELAAKAAGTEPARIQGVQRYGRTGCQGRRYGTGPHRQNAFLCRKRKSCFNCNCRGYKNR